MCFASTFGLSVNDFPVFFIIKFQGSTKRKNTLVFISKIGFCFLIVSDLINLLQIYKICSYLLF